MDLRNSRIPSRFSAWLAANGLCVATLLGFMITRLSPMASAISFCNAFNPVNARLARSLPAVKATWLGFMAGSAPDVAEKVLEKLAVNAAAEARSDDLRNWRRVVPRVVFISGPGGT